MNICKAVLSNEVFPAVGCTEPVSCAYAAAVAAEHLGAAVETLDLKVDIGTFKNGAAVVVPQSDGAKGNLIAAAMGAVLAQSAERLELLRAATPEVLAGARRLADGGACSYGALPGTVSFRVEVALTGGGRATRCVLSEGHANIESIHRDGATVFRRADREGQGPQDSYRHALRAMGLQDLLAAAGDLDGDDRRFLAEGVRMNLAMVERGRDVVGAARQLHMMRESGLLASDLFFRVKTSIAAAVDARMAGVAQPVMTSGGSGNQGVLAILVPHLVGRERGIAPERILESIAMAHLLNAYVKCFVGELSVVCGCAIAAAIAAAGAVVYQHVGLDMPRITHAVNNVIGDLSGLICDGAKPGCSMKTVSGVDAALRAAFMAIEGFGLSDDEGVLGLTAEESIRNLARVSLEGMLQVDPTVVDILTGKTLGQGEGRP